MESLRVEHFGPIGTADVSFGDLTFLIGPQASGKSLFWELLKLIVDKDSIQSVPRFIFDGIFSVRLMGRGAPSSSNSKVKSSGFSPVVQNSGAMYLSMAGVGRIIGRAWVLTKIRLFAGISESCR